MEPTVAHVRTFAAVADTIWPALDGAGPSSDRPLSTWGASASDLGIPARLQEALDDLPSDAQRADLLRLLRLLDTRAGGAALHRRAARFADLGHTEREAALRTMATSPLPQARQAFSALKSLVGRLLACPVPGEQRAVLWDDLGYPGPPGPPPQIPRTLEPVPVPSSVTWDADVVIVGSGAGGGVAAAVLAEAGLDVVVLEKGLYRSEADFTQIENEAYADLYLDGALSATHDLGIAMLAGACLGGGTVVNYTTSFATPADVLEEWDRVSGLPGVFTGDGLAASTRAVLDRLGVGTAHSAPSARDVHLEKGLREHGWHVGEIARNTRGCTEPECGFCSLGCRVGAKQSTTRTWLEDAAAAGTRIAVSADVRRIVVERGRAAGVVADVGGAELVVRARAVVIAAGALHTPAIIARSGLGTRALGARLYLHPVTAVWGRFAEPVDPWTGHQQTRYSDQFADLDGAGYGFKFETAAVHTVFPAAFMGWKTGEGFKRDLLAYRRISPAGILLRDRDPGRVAVGKDGRPTWRYKISAHDRAHVREAIRRGAELLAAAGAEEVLAPTTVAMRWRPGGPQSLDRFLERVDAIGYGSHQTFYVSFHQMGSAPMGARSADSFVDAENEAHETPGLFVLDGSCFPTSSGVNPMISISSIAHRGATHLAQRLT